MKITITVLAVILVICLSFSVFSFINLNKKINAIQNDYNNLFQMLYSHLIETEPLSASEVETFQHNMDILTDFCGQYTERPEKIAKACFMLKRYEKMNSARIVAVEERDILTRSFYCIKVITEDEEHYWFLFLYSSDSIDSIWKGEKKETFIYGVVQ